MLGVLGTVLKLGKSGEHWEGLGALGKVDHPAKKGFPLLKPCEEI